jgi:hypothetical protein
MTKKKTKKKKSTVTHVDINKNKTGEHIDGKSYSDMLQEMIDTSPIDLQLRIHLDNCYVTRIDNTPSNATLFVDDTKNVIKDSVNIQDPNSEMINRVTVYYKPKTSVANITRSNTDAINKYGVKTANVDKFNIWKQSDAIAQANKILHQSQRKNGIQIEVAAIAHPKFSILEWCEINLQRYHIKNLILLISRINFKFQAGKAPIMDICLNDFSKFNIDARGVQTAIDSNTSDASTLGRSLGTPQAIRQWIVNNIKYQFYYNKRRNPSQVLRDKRANCYDQADLAVEMMKGAGYTAYRVCGIKCGRYGHCNGKVNVDGQIITFDTTCKKLNKL